ncbi:MAG: DUF4261 domain-containing protein [Deltaproteobacteria bacterium]|nr:MAG: DUF4261 domain-containing protein [Deltaproteobacteria bacterium]
MFGDSEGYMTPQPPRYAVQLLLPQPEVLDPAVVHSQLLGWRDDVQLIPSKRGDHFGLAIPTHDLPLLAHVFPAAPTAYAAQLDEALQWSPTWYERFEAVARCRASLVVSMVAHRAINHATMLLAFLSVLDTVLGSLDDLRPTVLHWLPAQRVMPFSTYRLLRMELGPCGPAINVRIAHVGDSDTVADTVGLSDLGLPDLQTLATGRDPAALAFRLVNLARSMFVGDKLDCMWVEEASFSPPRRDALTLQLD